MNAGTGHLTRRVEAWDRGRAVEVGHDAAALIVLGGHNGDRLARDVDPDSEATLVDRRKVALEELRGEMGGVEVDAVDVSGWYRSMNRSPLA
jgi:hypothetical protein